MSSSSPVKRRAASARPAPHSCGRSSAGCHTGCCWGHRDVDVLPPKLGTSGSVWMWKKLQLKTKSQPTRKERGAAWTPTWWGTSMCLHAERCPGWKWPSRYPGDCGLLRPELNKQTQCTKTFTTKNAEDNHHLHLSRCQRPPRQKLGCPRRPFPGPPTDSCEGRKLLWRVPAAGQLPKTGGRSKPPHCPVDGGKTLHLLNIDAHHSLFKNTQRLNKFSFMVVVCI